LQGRRTTAECLIRLKTILDIYASEANALASEEAKATQTTQLHHPDDASEGTNKFISLILILSFQL
jgi:hypothetical protein